MVQPQVGLGGVGVGSSGAGVVMGGGITTGVTTGGGVFGGVAGAGGVGVMRLVWAESVFGTLGCGGVVFATTAVAGPAAMSIAISAIKRILRPSKKPNMCSPPLPS